MISSVTVVTPGVVRLVLVLCYEVHAHALTARNWIRMCRESSSIIMRILREQHGTAEDSLEHRFNQLASCYLLS